MKREWKNSTGQQVKCNKNCLLFSRNEMADVMIPSNNNAGGGGSKLQQQKSGVKTLSIIDTISELATDKTEASRLTLPSPVRVINHPGVPPRNPKVSVPLSSPLNSSHLGAKPRFVSSSPKKTPPPSSTAIHVSPKLNLSAIQQNLSVFTVVTNATSQNQPSPVHQQRDGQTPDWIRDIFHHAKRGNREKLVSSLPAAEAEVSTLVKIV